MIYRHIWTIHLIIIVSVIYSVFHLPIGYTIAFVVTGIGGCCIIGNVGLHRYFTHRSFTCNPITHWILLILCTFSAQGPVSVWVQSHKTHHKFSDTERDDHSPRIVGFWPAFFAHWGWMAQLRTANRFNPQGSAWKGLMYKTSRFVQYTTDYYVPVTLGFMLCVYAISPVLYFAYAWLVLIMLIGEGITNSVGHISGTSIDHQQLNWCLWWTETPYHHYHHLRPYAHRMTEFDPAGWFIERIRTP